MTGNILINRSSRFGSASVSAPNNNSPGANGNRMVTKSKLVPLRRPQDGSNNYRTADGDDLTVKSNSGLTVPRYVLPCFRCRSKKAVAMAFIATTAIFLSVCSAFIAYHSLSSMSPSGGHFLLPPKEWRASRELRMQARQERKRAHSSMKPGSDVKPVQYSEFETDLLNFLFTLRAEGIKTSMIPLGNDPFGQDMQLYTNLGCSVFRQMNQNQKPSNASHKEQLRAMWSSHISSVIEASRHSDDTSYMHKNWTAMLLKFLSPYSILDHIPTDENSNKAMSDSDIDRIIGILVRRFLGLLQISGNSPSGFMPPPLRIAVFGGATVEGKGCHRARVSIPQGSVMANPSFCAFPYRLEMFLNAILLPQTVLNQLRRTLGVSPGGGSPTDQFRLVEVINLGEEGTDSDYSNAIVRNRMYPPLNMAQITGYGGGPPDIVIDAYGLDDYGKEMSDSFSFYEDVWLPFADHPKECPKENTKPSPVIVRVLLEEEASSHQKVSASMMTVILGDAVDDVEEGEMSLPDDQNPEIKEMEAGGAFGMAGHIASSWTLAINLAYNAMSRCEISGNQSPHVIPKLRNNAVPPPPPDRCDNGIDPPCLFSFLAGPKGTAPRTSAIASSIMPYIVENTGWQPQSDMSTGFARKTGLVGTGAGATITLIFRNVTRPVRRLDVITLRSTSEVWKDGTAQFSIVTGGDFSHGDEKAEESAKVAREMSFEISAELIANRSNGEERHISYHFGLDLNEIKEAGQIGTDVLLRIILTKGSRFKVLGLMLCE
mmetsp:Transcript_26128/g.55114  ORF Transcript_26128/g.55114 Transcript_26128/m.55114 type:complete len:770 (-) Transcript_26128:501-2810(-)